MNVTGDSQSSGEVDFQYWDGSSWVSLGTSNENTGNGEAWWTLSGWEDGDLGSQDDLKLMANFTGKSDDYSTDNITVGLDKGSPSISLSSPSDPTGDESPEVEIDVSDDYSGPKNASLTVEDSDGDELDSNSCSDSSTCSVSLDDLDEGTYDVQATGYDEVGLKTESDDLSFEVDTTADFDLGLSSGDFDPEPGTIEMDGDQDVDITLEDLGEDGTAYCNDEDGDEIDSEDVNDGEDVEFTCEFDESDYGATTTDVEVEVCDEVDNCETSDDMYEYAFDRYSPSVTDLETDSGATSFNSEFDVNFEVTDDVSDIQEVEYYFNTFEDYGEGTALGYEEGTTTYSIDPSDLSSGEHTLNIRAQDEVDRWSSSTSIDFDYYPDRTPSVALDVQENMTVTAGESEDLNVEITNDGEIFVPSVDVEVSGGFVSESQQLEELAPGDTMNPVFSVEPSEEDLGSFDLTVSTENPSSEETVELLVRANEDQKQDINSTFGEYSDRLDALQENVTELKASGLNKNRNQRLDENFSDFKQTVEDAESAISSGEYYRADEILSGVESSYNNAQDTFDTVKEEQKRAQTRQTLIMVVLAVLALAAVGIGYLAYSDEYQVDIDTLKEKAEDIDISLPEGSKGGSVISRAESKINEMFGSEGEEDDEDHGWEGFKTEE